MPVSRRTFCAQGGLTLGSSIAAGFGFSKSSIAARFGFSKKTPFAVPDVAVIDHDRILKAANRYLGEQPITITAYPSPRSRGGKHDYFSEGDYWWPDPKNPGGPYIRRDGMSNPDNFNQHRFALIRLSQQVPALAAAWKVTGNRRYAQHAAEHLRAWFLKPETRMNPNLQYAQAIHGITPGRGIGIIDTLHLVEVVRAAALLEPANELSKREQEGLQSWFSEYLAWMTTSKNGEEEREAKNNHGTSWLAQAAEFARFTGNHNVTEFCRDRFKTCLVPTQIAGDGSFPLELQRTKPYGYSLFNLDVMATVCQILSTRDDSLFLFTLSDGRGYGKAVTFMFPFIMNKSSWPFTHDVQYWADWPVRQPSLLFAGVALGRSEYFVVWRRLNPDPTTPEIVRNFPVRQPLLWIDGQL
jgi:hypothetical protein